MHTVHVDFAELSKTSWRGSKTKSFILAIDRNTRFAVAKAGKEDSRAIVSLLSQKVFQNTKVVVSDHAKAFESRYLKDWARRRGIELQEGSPYHPQSNGLAERLIRDLKTFISMYPNMDGGWKATLEAAVRHHNRSRCSTIGCSPHFALNRVVPFLPADERLGIKEKISISERRFSVEEEDSLRKKQKQGYDKRISGKIPDLSSGDEILVKRGTGKLGRFFGPYPVVSVEVFDGIPKRVVYAEGALSKTAALRNVVKCCPRGTVFSGGNVGGRPPT